MLRDISARRLIHGGGRNLCVPGAEGRHAQKASVNDLLDRRVMSDPLLPFPALERAEMWTLLIEPGNA